LIPALVLLSVWWVGSAMAQTEVPARLVGHAVLPAATFLQPPSDAPVDLRVSGKFANGPVRVESLGTSEGRSAGRPTGMKLPFAGQPVQGHSGIKHMADGTYWVITDNGFGSKRNSGDAMLFFSRVTPDWTTGGVTVHQTVFLSDPIARCRFASFTKAPTSAT
jgi:hypothetical protein